MRVIPKPNLKVRDVFLDCISTVNDADHRLNLTNCVDLIEEAETDFETKFVNHTIYQIPQVPKLLGPIGKDEMKSVYEYRMVRVGMPGNKYYNQLKSAAPFGKCPLCAVRGVDTLDHYLPKSKFPILSVTPINLIPACTPCNKGKLIDIPGSSEEQTLHPYYDNVENEVWIGATISHSTPISFDFVVTPPNGWTDILKGRATTHFDSFGINELYSSHANEELRGAKNQLMKLYNEDPILLLQHLTDCYESRLTLGVNSWQAITYYTLLNDVWFRSGGVLV
jgi:hypothetical protein